jgi:hypothetical protein
MKVGPVVIVTFAISLCPLNTASSRGENHGQTPGIRQSHHPVIVELFTSEGCSTCPPADALLRRLEVEQPIYTAEVIAFEEHVDYWNREGWVDSYSAPEWTLRQQHYVSRFKESGPYTPQMVIDGQIAFVGSHQQAIEQAIGIAATRAEPNVDLIAVASPSDGTRRFNVHVGKLIEDGQEDAAEVWLAITEAGLHSDVKGGENAGKTLQHASVLRSLHKLGEAMGNTDVAFAATPQVKPKSSWNQDNLRVAVFVQEKKTLRIIGQLPRNSPIKAASP